MTTTPAAAPTLTHDDIPMEFTLEQLREHFTDVEIAAMNEGDDPILPGVDLTAKAKPEGEEDQGDDATDGVDPAPVTDPAPADPAPVVEEPEQDPPPPVNLAHYEKTVADLDTKLNDLQQSYDDGDLTAAEWRAQLATVVKEQATAQMALETAKAMPATPMEDYENAWFGKVDSYVAQHPYLMTDEHLQNWDDALRMVNTNRAYAKLPMAKRIETAHRIYAAHYESMEGKPLPTTPGLTAAQKAAAAVEAKPAIPEPRKDARPEAPTTLADLTNASDAGLEDGRFAQIDRIAEQDVQKGEAMFAAMSEAEQSAYLRGR